MLRYCAVIQKELPRFPCLLQVPQLVLFLGWAKNWYSIQIKPIYVIQDPTFGKFNFSKMEGPSKIRTQSNAMLMVHKSVSPHHVAIALFEAPLSLNHLDWYGLNWSKLNYFNLSLWRVHKISIKILRFWSQSGFRSKFFAWILSPGPKASKIDKIKWLPDFAKPSTITPLSVDFRFLILLIPVFTITGTKFVSILHKSDD